MKRLMLNKLMYAIDALLGLVVVLVSFFDVFRVGNQVANDAGELVMQFENMNLFEYCNFANSGMDSAFMYAPFVLVIICIVALVMLILGKQQKIYDNAVVIFMFIGVLLMAILASVGYSITFMIIAYVVAALLLCSLIPMFIFDKQLPNDVKDNCDCNKQ